MKLFRDLLEMIAPEVVLLTETNVPHEENISYFGRGDEAHMVYQFSLPPLLLHALTTGKAAYLTEWAQSVSVCPEGCTYFNFTASHDGIGVRPLTGLIPDDEFASLIDHVKAQGGQVSTKRNADGSDSPYELNITYFDALGGDEHQIDRFLCSQTVMLGLKGVPAFYFHSLTATPNDHDGVEATGRARSINRKKWNVDELENELHGTGTTARVFSELRRRIQIRTRQKAFHPPISEWSSSTTDCSVLCASPPTANRSSPASAMFPMFGKTSCSTATSPSSIHPNRSPTCSPAPAPPAPTKKSPSSPTRPFGSRKGRQS